MLLSAFLFPTLLIFQHNYVKICKMTSITLSVPAEVKEKMDNFPEINWSGFVRQRIIEKTEELDWRRKMLKKVEEQEPLDLWIADVVRKGRKGRFRELKRKGAI